MVALKDLAPKPASFSVGQGKRKIMLNVRPFTLRDDAWLSQNFEEAELVGMFEARDATVFGKVLWQMLTPKSKALVDKHVRFVDYDEKSKSEFDVDADGHEKLMSALQSPEERIAAMQAIMAARGVSNAIVEELVSTKKKTKPILVRFLTWLLPNMAGR